MQILCYETKQPVNLMHLTRGRARAKHAIEEAAKQIKKKKYGPVGRERKSLTGAFDLTALVVQPQQIVVSRDNKSARNCCGSGSFFGNSYYFSSG